MGADGVVMPPPAFDDDLGFCERVEDFAVEQFGLIPSPMKRDLAGIPEAANM